MRSQGELELRLAPPTFSSPALTFWRMVEGGRFKITGAIRSQVGDLSSPSQLLGSNARISR